MTTYTIDTSTVISVLLNPKSWFAELFFTIGDDGVGFMAPQSLQLAIDHHRDRLLVVTGLNASALDRMLALVHRRIYFFEDRIVPTDNYLEAARLLGGGDRQDIPFVALSIYFEAPLVTGEENLRRRLIAAGYDRVIDFNDLKQNHSTP